MYSVIFQRTVLRNVERVGVSDVTFHLLNLMLPCNAQPETLSAAASAHTLIREVLSLEILLRVIFKFSFFKETEMILESSLA